VRNGWPRSAYFLWAARLRRGTVRTYKSGKQRVVNSDDIGVLAREADALVKTYLDGAGLFAWSTNEQASGYESVVLGSGDRVTELDDVLHKVASQIKRFSRGAQGPPPPVRPEVRAMSTDELPEDAVEAD
jgi:hypothetical protein